MEASDETLRTYFMSALDRRDPNLDKHIHDLENLFGDPEKRKMLFRQYQNEMVFSMSLKEDPEISQLEPDYKKHLIWIKFHKMLSLLEKPGDAPLQPLKLDPNEFVKYSPIAFPDIHVERVYAYRYLHCESISEVFNEGSTMFLIKDLTSDSNRLLRVQIETPGIHVKLGQKMLILNPYYQIPIDFDPVIGLQDPSSSIILLDGSPEALAASMSMSALQLKEMGNQMIAGKWYQGAVNAYNKALSLLEEGFENDLRMVLNANIT